VARLARERTHEATRVDLVFEDDRRQRESGEPTLAPLVELLGVAGGELNAGLAEERSSLSGRDAEISFPDLGQIAVGAEPGNGQAGIAAARDDDLHRPGGTIHQLAHQLVTGAALHGMPVLEHENHRRAVHELVDEERKPCLGDRLRACPDHFR
jgi:hypothetical protein